MRKREYKVSPNGEYMTECDKRKGYKIGSPRCKGECARFMRANRTICAVYCDDKK